MKKKLISLLLLAATLLCSVACTGPTEDPSTETTTVGNTDKTDVTTVPVTTYNIPDASDHDGRQFLIMAADDRGEPYYGEEGSDMLESAAYKRTIAVEEHLGIETVYEIHPANWKAENDYSNAIKTSVLGGGSGSEYDLMWCPVVFVGKLFANGYFMDINTMNIDLTNPWWASDLNESISLNGKLYLLAGTFAVSTYGAANVVFFNKNLFKEHNMDYPYEAVGNGTWTLQYMFRLLEGKRADRNGDRVIDVDNDLVGMATHPTPFNSVQISCNIPVVERDGDEWIFNGTTDRFLKVYDLVKAQYDSQVIYFTEDLSTTTYETYANRFATDHSFMTTFPLCVAGENLSDMKSDYGILPMPKLEETDDYKLDIGVSSVQWVVPANTGDPELTADFCEYYAYQNWKNVVPSYFELTLKVQYSRDPETSQMLDIIGNSITVAIDSVFGYTFEPQFNTFSYFFMKDRDPASYFKTNLSRWERKFKQMIDDVV